ncbi:MAG: hypothetical protein Q9191_005877 [Dirinaria sp. TL-2023a]
MTSKTIVLITGANSGIGFDSSAAIAAASADYHVVMGSRSLEKGQKALSELQARKLPGSLSLVQLDVTDEASISQAVQSIAHDFGRLDVLVNNAGIVSKAPTFKADLRETLETNTIAPAAVTEAFTDLLLKSEKARLIYVSSDLGSLTLKQDKSYKYHGITAVAYRMSKAALNMLMLCHEAQFEGKIRVFAFNPGFVVTNLTGEEDRQSRIDRGAGSSEGSAQTLRSIVVGERDADAGQFVVAEGVLPW